MVVRDLKDEQKAVIEEWAKSAGSVVVNRSEGEEAHS